jgi:hypothetical protein
VRFRAGAPVHFAPLRATASAAAQPRRLFSASSVTTLAPGAERRRHTEPWAEAALWRRGALGAHWVKMPEA